MEELDNCMHDPSSISHGVYTAVGVSTLMHCDAPVNVEWLCNFACSDCWFFGYISEPITLDACAGLWIMPAAAFTLFIEYIFYPSTVPSFAALAICVIYSKVYSESNLKTA